MVGEELHVVRSYQRIFRPDRRIYQVDGRTLPIPGGVPLRWLGWALASLLVGLVLAGGSRLVPLVLAAGVAAVAVRAGRARMAPALAGGVVLGCIVAIRMLATVDWPLRLIVMPALVATLMTQVTPDGRPVHRFVIGWGRAHLNGWRSIGRSVDDVGRERARTTCVRVAADEHGPVLLRARIVGPARVEFSSPVSVRRRRRGRLVVRPLDGGRGLVLDQIRVEENERLAVRS